jgi:succinoglycan biosynthesis protein ExoA
VNENVPTVTVLIPARPDEAEVKAVVASRKLDYPNGKLDIILARGKQPSMQRNTALRAAKGELIYFLDDDSMPRPDNLMRAVRHFQNPAVQLVGGPNVCPPDAPALEQIFALVLQSWLAFGPSRARYAPVGAARESGEKELILCNLLARRQTMLDLGGFNEALYPNEENALMDQLQKRGDKLIYDPELYVHRRPRATLKAFVRMVRTYGRGRAEQFRVNPTLGSALNFVPPMFLAWLALTLVMLLVEPQIGRWLLAPLAFYAIAVVAQGLALAFQPALPGHDDKFPTRLVRSVAATPLIVLTHLLYGFGFWRGLFTRLNRASNAAAPVKLEHLSP